MNDNTLDAIQRVFNKPHRIGRDATLAFVKVNPWTGLAYVDKAKLAPLAQQGYDVDDYAARIEADLRARGKWPE